MSHPKLSPGRVRCWWPTAVSQRFYLDPHSLFTPCLFRISALPWYMCDTVVDRVTLILTSCMRCLPRFVLRSQNCQGDGEPSRSDRRPLRYPQTQRPGETASAASTSGTECRGREGFIHGFARRRYSRGQSFQWPVRTRVTPAGAYYMYAYFVIYAENRRRTLHRRGEGRVRNI